MLSVGLLTVFLVQSALHWVCESKEWSFLSEEPKYTLSYYESLEPSDTFDIIYDMMKRVLSKTVKGDQSGLVYQFELQLITAVEQRSDSFVLSKMRKDHPFWKLAYSLDVMELDNNGSAIVLRGSSTMALAVAFNWYLRDYCNTTYDWRTYTVTLPDTLPLPSYHRKIRSVPFSYYENVCTVSYTQAFWTWDEWENHLDWMAMEGINLPLSFTGQEYVWAKAFNRFGFTTSDLETFFSGTGFFAWQRMGNLRGSWAKIDANNENTMGIPESAIMDQYNLQIQILARMSSFGMVPALTAFAGHVPNAIVNLFPNASVTPSPNWGGFEEDFCCDLLLNFSDPLFEKIGSAFMEEQIKYFGASHVYQCDSFNEMDPPSNNSEYLKSATAAIYNGMNNVDENAVWLMQGWLFVSSGFWNNENVKAYLSGVNDDALMILDLYSEISPQYERTDSYFGKPFIWNTLHNFGGNDGMRGTLNPISIGVPNALKMNDSTIVGVGITMEGIWQNWIVYDLTLDMAYKSDNVDLNEWIDRYSKRIYGLPHSISNTGNAETIQELSKGTWLLLKDTVYNISNFGGVTKSIIVKRPSLSDVAGGFMASKLYYNPMVIQKGWQNFISISNDTGLKLIPKFRYDLVDLTRQALSDQFFIYYKNITSLYKAGQGTDSNNAALFADYQTKMLSIIDDMDTLLNTDVHWMVGPWIAMSQKHDSTNNETIMHFWEFEARNQITLWGPRGEISDYASKQWGGLVGTYYKHRWNLFLTMLQQSYVAGQTNFNQTHYDNVVYNTIEEPWQTNFTQTFPTSAIGDSVSIACQLYQKWNWFGDTGCNYL